MGALLRWPLLRRPVRWIALVWMMACAGLIRASDQGALPQQNPAPPGFVHLCHAADATPQDTAATEAAAIASGYRADLLRARPYERIGRTAAQPNGVEFGYGYTISWSYIRDGFVLPGAIPAHDTAPSTLFATMNQAYPGGFAAWHALFVEAFARWAAVTGNRYVYEPEDDGAPLSAVGLAGRRGDVRIGMRPIPGSISGFNFYPSSGSDMVLDEEAAAYSVTTFLNLVLHEHGHGLGLAHVCPANDTKLMEPFLNDITRPTRDEIVGAQRYYGDLLNHATSATSEFRQTRQVTLGVGAGAVDQYLLSRPGTYSVGVQPLGASYLEGPQEGSACTPGTAIDTRTYGDLSVQVLDVNGNVIVDRNAQPIGSGERAAVRLRADQVPARVRVTNVAGDYQMYQLIAGKLIATAAERPIQDVFADGFE